jgi:hypothetical protein
VWVLGACSSSETSDGDDGQGSAGRLAGAVCALLDRLDEQEEAFEAPGVYALDEAALAKALAGRREVLALLAEETEGELHALLEQRALAQPAVDEAMLDTWEEDRVRFVEEHNDAWLDEVVGQEVRREDGEEIDVAEYWWATRVGYDRLVVGCRAPELADGPEQERSQDVPPGRLVLYRPPPGGGTTEEGGDLVVTTERGTNEHELKLSEKPGASDTPRPWAPTGHFDFVQTADGRLVVDRLLVNARAGDEFAMVEVSLDGTIVDFVQRSDEGPISCPGWDTRGERVLAATESRYAHERRVLLLDLTRATPSGPAPLPFATASCSDFITEDRIVVSDAALDIDDERAVWTVGVDGSDPRELYRPTADGCRTQVGSVDPAGTRVALAQTCDDPLGSGVMVVDLASGESQRVVTGSAALPKWSPDGEWLVFGYAPPGRAGVGTWMAQPDGRQLRQVLEAPSWFPVWVPPA